MDGASKFVRGDAIAGIIITVINIVGGLIIGMAEFGMPLKEAARVFTHLTIGDGLVSQVPAFLISLAAGLLVTRSTQKSNMPREFLQQIFARPQALAVTGAFLGILVFTSLPTIPLLTLGGACLGLARMLSQRETREVETAANQAEQDKKAKEPEERVEDYLTIDPMEVELGVGLIRLADPNRGGDLLDRVQRVRQNVAGDIGILMPKVRIRDNMRLGASQYRIKIADIPVAQGELEPTMLLAIDSGMTSGKVDGITTKDPAFGSDAKWINPGHAEQAELYGYTVVEPGAVLATHLTEVCRRHADEILTRDATKHLTDELKTASPAVVNELIPAVMTLSEVQAILQLLLREQVSIRQLSLILETLGDHAPRSKDPILLTEYVRHRLARQICSRYRNTDGELHVVACDPALEDKIRAGYEHTERGLFIRLAPQSVEAICRAVGDQIAKLAARGHSPILLVSPQIRAAVKRVTENHLPNLIVLSFNEVTRDTKIVTVGMVSDKV
jgi:flagellar biosynthesis protein FlhA